MEALQADDGLDVFAMLGQYSMRTVFSSINRLWD
jgi:hypothetical protein